LPWLPEPDAGEPPLWEGPLELLPEDTVRERREPEHGFDPRSMPHAEIRRAESWPLTELYPPDSMPPEMRTRLDEAEFYVVRLRVSFRPTKDEVVIKWARFAVELLGEGEIEAEAIHPELVEEQVERTRRYTLSPTLKFAEVEVGAGSIEFGFQHTEQEPFMWGASEPVTSPSWDFEPTTGHRLYGPRRMHLLVRARPGTTSGRARLHLVSDVEVKRRFVGRATRPQDRPPLDVTLWGPDT
jgi:hypothetical protein